MKAYKGFNEDMTCRGFQFEEGKTYEEKEAELCNSGFHACEYPLDVFGYYAPAGSVFHEVELEDVCDKRESDSKVCGKKITIGARLSITRIVELSVQYIHSKIDRTKKQHVMKGHRSAATNTGRRSVATNTGDCSVATNTGNCSAATNTGHRSVATNTGDCSAATNTGDCSAATNTGHRSVATNTGNCSAATNTGDCSAATNTGNWSAATNTGDCSAATNTGNWSAAKVTGKQSVAVATGYQSKASGALGCWIVLAELSDNNEIINMQTARVDGKKIKPDTWYQLKGGDFVEVEE